MRAGFCLKGGEARRVPRRGSCSSAFFSSDSGTTKVRGEHVLPSTKVVFNLNAQGLHLSVAQFLQ